MRTNEQLFKAAVSSEPKIDMMNGYVVPVTVGGSNQRFGTNRSSKRAQGVVVAIGAAMAMCLMVSVKNAADSCTRQCVRVCV